MSVRGPAAAPAAGRPAAARGRPRLTFFVAVILLAGCGQRPARVVVYCAQDQEFAVGALQRFTERTGLAVAAKYDTEADKSVSLFRALLAERTRPRCDVFWNNEVLSTIRLQRLGLLEPYLSPSAEPYPEEARGPGGAWHAFAARARVLVVNTRLVAAADRPRGLLELAEERWRGRVVMARPQFGTSATQAACLFDVLGPARARDYYRGLRANGVQLAPGNKQVAEWVGRGRTPSGGEAAVGVTDTDDAVAEVEAGSAIAVIFPDADRPADDPLGTLFIPNTVAIVRGGPNTAGARRLVDHLLSPEVEEALARGPGRQIPLNPRVRVALPPQVPRPDRVKAMRVDFGRAAERWDEAQRFLIEEFARP